MIRYQSFEHLLEEMNSQRPDAPAFFYEEDGVKKSISSSSFYAKVLHRAADLKVSGRRCAAVLCDGSLLSVTAIFASVLAGMQTVLLDENTPSELLERQLLETDAELLLCGDKELEEELASVFDMDARNAGRLSAAKPRQILFFTSGTTASVKAVVLTDASLLSSAWNGSMMQPLSEDDILINLLPMNHVFGFVCGMLWGLQCGAAVALGRGARHYADDLRFFRPTAVSVVPLLLSFLLRFDALNEDLRLVLVGAGSCPKELLDAVRARQIRVSFGYGLTETSSGVALSIGDDPFAMTICPDDRVTLADDGEILIEAPTCMMKGYYQKEDDTAAALIGDILITGDLGRFDENGLLHITGRKKEVLLLSDGTKIFLPEYEARLLEALPGREFAVIEFSQTPVLIIKGDPEEREAVQEALKPVMASYARGQQLRGIYFTNQPLPRTATGKVKRWILENKLKEGPHTL